MDLKAKNLLIPTVFIAIVFLIILARSISTPVVVWAASTIQLQNPSEQYLPKSGKLSSNFPTPIQKWKVDIEKQAASLDMDPNLIAAVILNESSGDPFAYSSSGAVGLCRSCPGMELHLILCVMEIHVFNPVQASKS